MPTLKSTLVCLLLSVVTSMAAGLADEPLGQQPEKPLGQQPEKQRVFLIGNSLTWDTLPGLLDGEVRWHVDCGKNLAHIAENPDNPCVKTSVRWTDALRSSKLDVLCVQPHFGTTAAQDAAVIATWLDLQPQAKLVIHTGWNRHKEFHDVYHATVDDEQMTHAPAYFDALRAKLIEKYPQLEIRSTRAIDVLDEICHDIEQGTAPLNSLAELYRDEIHMTTDSGRYLMHNLMRIALDQPHSDQGFQCNAPLKQYLDQKLEKAQLQATESQGAS